jgi:hypothetical protein
MLNELELENLLPSPKTKNRDGLEKKRITDFDITLGPKPCQRDSAKTKNFARRLLRRGSNA